MGDIHKSKEELSAEIRALRANVEELKRERVWRKQAEARTAHVNGVLRAIRNVNQLIAKGTDHDRLLQGTCRSMVETAGYQNVWFALLDESGATLATAEAGLGRDFLPIAERLKRGDLTACARTALTQSGVVVTQDPSSTCADCPLAPKYSDRAALTIRLALDGRSYGLMSASIPRERVADKEERTLFEDLAADVAFALHDMELEEGRSRAEEALRQREELFRLVSENAFDGINICEFDPDTLRRRLVFCNDRYVEISGYSRQQLADATDLNQLVVQHGSPEKKAHHYDCIVKCMPFVGTASWKRPDGKANIYEWSAVSLKKGDKFHIVGVDRDVTERKRAEEELEAEKQRIEQYLNIAEVMLAVVGPDESITMINDKGCRVLGYKERELLGRNWFDLLVPETRRDEVRGVFRELMAGHIAPVEYHENPLLTSRGDERLIAFRNTVVRDSKGQIVGILTSGQDITNRKRAEAAARRAQEQLLAQQRREKERVQAELAKLRDELIRNTRLVAIGQVSASIAHELRNPLGAVRNAAYYLRRRYSEAEEPLREYLGIIDQEVSAADRIIGNLLAMVRPREAPKSALDLGRVVREVFDRIGEVEGLRYRMSLAPDPFVVHASTDQLQQVVHNLLANAVSAMGGSGEVLIEASRSDDWDTITFTDTGPGVAPDVRETLFHPLVTTKATGTGLGLTICKQIVESHGGTIELVHHEGRGAAFRIRLPRK